MIENEYGNVAVLDPPTDVPEPAPPVATPTVAYLGALGAPATIPVGWRVAQHEIAARHVRLLLSFSPGPDDLKPEVGPESPLAAVRAVADATVDEFRTSAAFTKLTGLRATKARITAELEDCRLQIEKDGAALANALAEDTDVTAIEKHLSKAEAQKDALTRRLPLVANLLADAEAAAKEALDATLRVALKAQADLGIEDQKTVIAELTTAIGPILNRLVAAHGIVGAASIAADSIIRLATQKGLAP